jgi:hypothetical protein
MLSGQKRPIPAEFQSMTTPRRYKQAFASQLNLSRISDGGGRTGVRKRGI